MGSPHPKWAPFTPYLERAVARVQKQWERELIESRLPPPVDAEVTVVFWVSPDGKISRIEEVKSQPGDAGAKACISAITRPGTFGAWTVEMRNILGSEGKMTFTFHYEK